jgi:hypothetical protein
MRWLYFLYASCVLSAYAASSLWGFEITPTQHGVVPANVRQSGYRSYSFWRGGK